MRNRNFDVKYIMIILIVVIIIAVIAALFIFMSSGKKEKVPEKLTTADGKEYYQPTQEETRRAKELANKLKNNLPTMNGGINTIGLAGGIEAKILGTSELEAEMKISHTTEEEAFKDLLAGRCELIFSSQLEDSQEREAASKNIPLEIKPIMYNALVFTVNSANPVDELTQEELRDIYSGKITNWQELGGDDAEIIVYQNKDNPEVQKLMQNFMGEEQLIEAKTEAVPGEKKGIVETYATYNNEENAIGYTLYQYPEEILELNEMKYIKVDGIDVTKEKMTFQEYPILEYQYAIYNSSKTEMTNADELAEWLSLYDGQVAIEKAGYIPVKNIKVQEFMLPKSEVLGTSEEKRNDESSLSHFYYTVKQKDYGEVGQDAMIVAINGLKDEELEKNINQFLREAIEEMQSKTRAYEEYIEELPSGYSKNKISVQTECKNGYLAIQVLLTYKSPKGYTHVYDGRSIIYDLYTGNELTFEDLFYQEVEAETVQIIDKQIKSMIAVNLAADNSYIELKRPFEGITNDIYVYGLDNITFTNNNMYFAKGVTFKLDTYFDNLSLVDKERNMEDIWKDNIKVEKVRNIS